MKKILLGLSAFIMMFAASCEQQEWTPNLGNEATVSFNVATPEIAVKAYSDGTAATQLQYAVYDEIGNIFGDLTKTVDLINGSATVELDLAAGDTYKVVFWAAAENAPYDVNFGAKTMTVDYSEAVTVSNDEKRDAFYACEDIIVSGPMSVDVVLKRPFAQLNIGANDFEAMVNAGREIKLSKVKVPAYKTLNLLDGTVEEGDPTATTFNYAPIPDDTERFPVEGYKYMAMNYILVGADQELVDVEFHFATEGKAYTNSRTVGSVPVQRNHRTNIYGKVLTTGVDVNVEIKPDYDEEDNLYVLVDSREAAQAALDKAVKGTVVALQPNVNYGTLEIKANPGHSNTTLVDVADAWAFNYVRTIKDVTIKGAKGAKVNGIIFKTGAQPGDQNNTVVIENLTIENVEFTDAFTASNAGYNAPIMITTSNATVNGLTVKGCKLMGDNSKLNLVYLYGADGSKNVTLTGNTVSGIARLCELRGTENVTITDNVIKNTYEHAMLLAGANYAGNVTITGNTADGIHDRFVRMAGAGDAVVVIKDNIITNYLGADEDFIKVTDGNNVTIENNICSKLYTVATAEAAQAALDNAKKGTIIALQPNVNYGTLVFRQNSLSKVVDITTAGGDVPGNEKYRRIEDLTIIGAEGAVVDGFDFQVGWIDGSGASYIDVKNFTVEGVTFRGNKTPFNFEGAKGSALGIEGLKIVGCKMTDTEGKYRFVFQQISGYKELNDKTTNEYVMTSGIKNLTITKCEVTGAYMVIESRAMENLTITENIFRGIKARDMLITSDVTNHADKTYTGYINIAKNTSIEGEERFVRASLNNSDAVVVIRDNTIVDYKGEDPDFIKVDGAKPENLTVENNIRC